jgi:hypothetical protein
MNIWAKIHRSFKKPLTISSKSRKVSGTVPDPAANMNQLEAYDFQEPGY